MLQQTKEIVIYGAIGAVHDEYRFGWVDSLIMGCQWPDDDNGEKAANYFPVGTCDF